MNKIPKMLKEKRNGECLDYLEDVYSEIDSIDLTEDLDKMFEDVEELNMYDDELYEEKFENERIC